MKKVLNAIDLDFNPVACIAGYENYTLERLWNGISYLTINIKKSVPNADKLVQDTILWFDKEYHKAFIIERVVEKLENNVRTLEIIAPSLNVLLHDYITIPPSGYETYSVDGTRETAVRSYVDFNCINPVDSSRVQYPIILGTNHGYGDVTIYTTRLKNLSEEVVNVLSPEWLGHRLSIDLSQSKFVFDVLKGTDKSAGQALNSRILFGTKYGNLARYEKTQDYMASKTVAYVGGQGEGKDRLIQKVDASGSGRKKEVFIDARNAADGVELTEKGNQALSASVGVENFSFEALDRQFKYETDWDLGDFVTIVQDDGTYEDRQVVKITEYYEKAKVHVVPEFGVIESSIGDRISSISSRLSQVETSEGRAIDDNAVSTSKTWSSTKIKSKTDVYDVGYTAGTPLGATTGAMGVTMDSSIKTITPTGNCTFNASGGILGQRCTFIITTSGTTSYTLTFGTNFRAASTLATGITTSKKFAIEFVFDGTTWVETGRTAAM